MPFQLKFHEGSVVTPVKLCRAELQSPETLFSSTTAHVTLEAIYHASSPRTAGNVTPLLIQYKGICYFADTATEVFVDIARRYLVQYNDAH